jgi:hypothetical protein
MYQQMKTLSAIVSFVLLPNIGLGSTVEIHSVYQIDEPRGYCIDIRGHKSKAKVNRGL